MRVAGSTLPAILIEPVSGADLTEEAGFVVIPASEARLDDDAVRQGSSELTADLARLGIAGGAVYDALVGAAARQHGLPLFSRDRRALPVYEPLGAQVRLVD